MFIDSAGEYMKMYHISAKAVSHTFRYRLLAALKTASADKNLMDKHNDIVTSVQ